MTDDTDLTERETADAATAGCRALHPTRWEYKSLSHPCDDCTTVARAVLAARAPSGDTAAQALRDAADAARGMHDPVAPDCGEWADWLDARADRADRAEAGAQALRDAAAAVLAEDVPGGLYVGAHQKEYTTGGIALWLRRRADALAQAPDPDISTATVPVEVYVREPGPEVTEVESLDGYRIPRTGNGLWLRRTWDDLTLALRGPLVPVGTRARLRDAGGEGR